MSETPICGERDKYSPRICDRPKGHDGVHDDSGLPKGTTTRTKPLSEAQRLIITSAPQPAALTARNIPVKCAACGCDFVTGISGELSELSSPGKAGGSVASGSPVAPREFTWVIKFDDADREDEVFGGAGAEDAARRRFEQAQVSWNCTLFVEEAYVRFCTQSAEQLIADLRRQRNFEWQSCKDAQTAFYSAQSALAAKERELAEAREEIAEHTRWVLLLDAKRKHDMGLETHGDGVWYNARAEAAELAHEQLVTANGELHRQLAEARELIDLCIFSARLPKDVRDRANAWLSRQSQPEGEK